MPEPNIPMLRKYVEWVEEQDKLPEIDREWNQGAWFWKPQPRDQRGRFIKTQEPNLCGTKCCVAGRIGLDAGFMLNTGGYITSTPPGEEHWIGKPVSVYAAEALGLDFESGSRGAMALFDAGNSAEMVRAIAEEAAGERL